MGEAATFVPAHADTVTGVYPRPKLQKDDVFEILAKVVAVRVDRFLSPQRPLLKEIVKIKNARNVVRPTIVHSVTDGRFGADFPITGGYQFPSLSNR